MLLYAQANAVLAALGPLTVSEAPLGATCLLTHCKLLCSMLCCCCQVYDVAWCPSNSTVFAAVTADGRLELWDFAVSTLRPVCQHAVTKSAMTALLFAKVGSSKRPV